MDRVLSHIDARQRRHDALPFFARLERPGRRHVLEAVYPALCFWVFTFQDVLALNLEAATDPEVVRQLAGHREDDSGHQKWYLADLEALGLVPDLGWLFGPEHATTRLSSHRLVAGVLGASFDTSRVAAVLALEAAGECIFSRMPRYVRTISEVGELAYFSDHHFEVEQEHDLHDDALRQWLKTVAIDDAGIADGIATVDAVFDAIDAMIEGYESRAVACG